MNRKRLLHILSALPLICASAWAAAQDYPSRPLRIILGYPPGGATDVAARVLAKGLSERLKQPVVVENRPGAAGSIGAEAAARSAPDGYTIFWLSSAATLAHAWNKNLRYDVIKDFAPISQVASFATLIAVHPSLPAKSLKELVDLAKAQPGKLDFATSGSDAPRLVAEYFKIRAGVDMVHVPYKGTGPMMIDLLSGVVKVGFPSLPGMPEYINQGKLRALAITSPERDARLPGVPTVEESGYPGFVMTIWSGIAFPARTPPEIVRRVHAETAQILKQPDVIKTLTDAGFVVAGSPSPEEFAERVKADTEMAAKIIKEAHITLSE
jgi:tripartite-type tricarboxylate transporter receptor subunit TctC